MDDLDDLGLFCEGAGPGHPLRPSLLEESGGEVGPDGFDVDVYDASGRSFAVNAEGYYGVGPRPRMPWEILL